MSCRAALIIPALLSACTGWAGPEEQVLGTFFEASGLYDRTLLADVSTVTFDPRRDGTVRNFVVEGATPAVRRQALRPADDAMIAASLGGLQSNPADVTAASLEVDSKDLTVNADLRTPDGVVGRRQLVVTMQRTGGMIGGELREGRWVVTAVR